MSTRILSKWVTCPHPRETPKVRLFCLPFAGGGASTYRVWSAGLPPWIEVCPIQLPGREDRYREAALTSVVGLSRAVARELLPYLDLPFAFFGHSMGALLSFEVGRALRHSHAPGPFALFLGAYPAPHEAVARRHIHHLPDADFIEELRQMEGTPEAVLQSADLMAFMLPVLRADFQACDTYTHDLEPPLDCPLFLFGGSEDREVVLEKLHEWRLHSRAGFSVESLPGGHFFVQSQRDRLLGLIAGHLSDLSV